MANESSRTRAAARAAIRAELSKAAVALVLARGYEAVTVSELAEAAGVSRSTFLRYLGSKDVAVLEAVVHEGERVTDELLARPDGEAPWTALRRCFDFVLDRNDPATSLKLWRLVTGTPALKAADGERRERWRDGLAEALLARAEAPSSRLAALSLAGAATSCLSVALDAWAANDGRRPSSELLDEAFEAIAAIA